MKTELVTFGLLLLMFVCQLTAFSYPHWMEASEADGMNKSGLWQTCSPDHGCIAIREASNALQAARVVLTISVVCLASSALLQSALLYKARGWKRTVIFHVPPDGGGSNRDGGRESQISLVKDESGRSFRWIAKTALVSAFISGFLGIIGIGIYSRHHIALADLKGRFAWCFILTAVLSCSVVILTTVLYFWTFRQSLKRPSQPSKTLETTRISWQSPSNDINGKPSVFSVEKPTNDSLIESQRHSAPAEVSQTEDSADETCARVSRTSQPQVNEEEQPDVTCEETEGLDSLDAIELRLKRAYKRRTLPSINLLDEPNWEPISYISTYDSSSESDDSEFPNEHRGLGDRRTILQLSDHVYEDLTSLPDFRNLEDVYLTTKKRKSVQQSQASLSQIASNDSQTMSSTESSDLLALKRRARKLASQRVNSSRSFRKHAGHFSDEVHRPQPVYEPNVEDITRFAIIKESSNSYSDGMLPAKTQRNAKIYENTASLELQQIRESAQESSEAKTQKQSKGKHSSVPEVPSVSFLVDKTKGVTFIPDKRESADRPSSCSSEPGTYSRQCVRSACIMPDPGDRFVNATSCPPEFVYK